MEGLAAGRPPGAVTRRPHTMKPKLFISLVGAVALAAGLTAGSVQASKGTPPAIAAKRAQAARILEEISAIDESLNTTSEQYDGARVRLAALRKDLAAEQTSLARAQVRYHQAQDRVAKLLVWLYTSSHSSSLDVILGATSLGEMLRLSDDENAISNQTAAIAAQAEQARIELEARVHALAIDREAAQATVRELAQQRSEILRGLAERRRLLSSVQAQVSKLEAQERARQERLAAEARARLEAEAAARAKAEAAAAARARAAAAAAAQARAAQQAQAAAAASTTAASTAATTTTATGATTTTTSSSATVDTTAATDPAAAPATSAPTTTTPPAFTAPSPIPTQLLPAGHPEAAEIALQYLGVPYLWGGATPSGFDCSGLVTYVFAQLGITLPHFAAAQWDYGVPVTVAQLQPGDLVFFDALDHVGIYLGDGEFINAPHTGTFVRIDTLSEPWYANHYVGARRI